MNLNQSGRIFSAFDWIMRGVVDSEDIPLNLSRELLQDSALIKKLSLALQRKILRFFQGGNGKCSRDRRERGDCKTVEIREFERESREDEKFLKECGNYFREGMVSVQ